MADETSSRFKLAWPLSRRPEQRVAPRQPAASPLQWRACLRARILVCAALLGLWTVAIETRLFYLQVYRYAEMCALADNQQLHLIDLPAKRGDVEDRNGKVLASSVDAISIAADPSEIEDPAATAASICGARDLQVCGGRSGAELADRLTRKKHDKSRFMYIVRRITPDEAKPLRDLSLEGLMFLPESKRYYPNDQLAAHVLGFVGLDNKGLAGIEQGYDRLIRGREGKMLAQMDEKRRTVETRDQTLPLAGESVELTIDTYLQYVTEQELKLGVEENKAASGRAVIMDPRTGQILAMANYPTYDSNNPGAVDGRAKRNRTVEDIYEPGSTFKVVTASAALQERVITPDDLVDTGAGTIAFGSRVVRDTHHYGVLTFTDVIVKSSNVGAIKVGQRLGPERLTRYVKRFGFGQKLAPDFPGQAAGIVWNPAQLNPSALASVSMGYQIGVTPLQMATAVSAVANGGELLQPRIVRGFIKDGRRTEVQKKVLGRPIERDTAATLTTMMEQVVDRGTATAARIPGYTIAGKTGTAAQIVGRAYSRSEYYASFVGFIPSRNPAFTIIVVIDSPHGPRGYYGGAVAAPVFKRIAEKALQYAGIPPTLNPLPPVIVARNAEDASGASPATVSVTGTPRPIVQPGIVPDLRGLSAREALRVLTQVGMAVAHIDGDGFVVAQEPLAGSEIVRGDTCTLKLDRHPPALAIGGTQP